MKVSICRPSELSVAEVERWRSFQRNSKTLGSPFLTPEFAIVMSEHRPDVKLALLEDGDGVAGYFVFERHRLGIGRAFCYGLSDVQGVVHAPEYEWSGAELLEACRLTVWEFDHLISDQVRCFAPQDVALRYSPIVDLAGGWDNWISRKKSTKRIKKVREHERKLVRELGAPRFEIDNREIAHLELLMRWKSAQYRRTGRRDRFAQNWLRDGVRKLFDTRTDGFSAQLSVMFVRDRPASLHLSLQSKDILAGWFPAYDVNLRSYGVGVIHQLHLLRNAADSGIRFFDCGAGEEKYKQAFRDFDMSVAKGSLSRASAVALAWRVQTAPRRLITDFVLRHPPLRKAARRALNLFGSVRSRLQSE
jgi:CelD/BcsL family acetyltransferase involved in cellulose biosynthesis